jgi:hypothetical protein
MKVIHKTKTLNSNSTSLSLSIALIFFRISCLYVNKSDKRRKIFVDRNVNPRGFKYVLFLPIATKFIESTNNE